MHVPTQISKVHDIRIIHLILMDQKPKFLAVIILVIGNTGVLSHFVE